MNILYVVKGLSVIEPQGILQLSAVTKKQGHKSFVGVIEEGDILKIIKRQNIDLVAFSILSTEAKAFLRLAHDIRLLDKKITVIAGGPHPTYFPEMIDTWPIDAIIVGEGDLIIGKITSSLEEGKGLDDIPNVHTKNKKNPVLPLVEDLDELPYPDRELLHVKAPFRYIRMNSFMATRGCPYNCSYCYNHAYLKLYKGNKIYRRRSVDNLIREIEIVKEEYGLDFVRFGDDVFVTGLDEWAQEFAEKYFQRIGVPFYYMINPNFVTRELISVLRKAGNHSIGMAIESGNEKLRKTLLNRNVSDQSLFNAYAIANEFGIKTFANSMLGLPRATIEDDVSNLEMTLRLRPTYASFTVFLPFPGTELYRYSLEQGYLGQELSYDDNFPDSMVQDSVLKHVSRKHKEIHQNILMLGALANWQPWLSRIIVRHCIYWEPNTVFWVLGFFVRNYLQMKIWPFRVNLRTFFEIVLRVFRIDKSNYRYTKSKTV